MEKFNTVMDSLAALLNVGDDFGSSLAHISRYILPVLAIWILYRCVRSMLREWYEPETWAYFIFDDETRMPLRHWESIIGRSRYSDIWLNYPTISRSHAALIRGDDGRWSIFDLDSKGGTYVNGEAVEGEAALRDGDVLTIADVDMTFLALTVSEQLDLSKRRRSPGRNFRPAYTFFILSLFIALLSFCNYVNCDEEYQSAITLAFLTLIVIIWLYYIIMRTLRRSGFEVECIAFFLCSLGLSVTASSTPDSMAKQIMLTLAGVVVFVLLGWWLRDLKRVKKMRWPAAAIAIGLLGVNLLLAQTIFGAKNWIEIGGFTLQPSEFVKIAFIYAGAATLDRLYMGRNLFMFIGFSAVCVGSLALIGDFGTALVFFATFLVIAFMRSGNLATVILAISAAALAGFLMFSIKPYIAARFSTWGHVWDDPYSAGYQQSRAMSAAASGGLFGQGAGAGWLVGIFAADMDMVFAVLSEELGLLIAVCAVLAIVVLAAFTVKNATTGRSSFYVIAACSACSMMMVQMALNVFGTLDILPFTGVTFPFVSRGGSSLISCWALLAFIKATDTRKGSSFAIRLISRQEKKVEAESYDEDFERDEEYYCDEDAYCDEGGDYQ